MNRAAMILIGGLLMASSSQAQMPSGGREIGQWTESGRVLRLFHLPKRTTTLVPIRFALESQSGAEALNGFDHAIIEADPGTAAYRVYIPKPIPLRYWGDEMIEVRETFRTPGPYRLTFVHGQDSSRNLSVKVEVGQNRYLTFQEEMGVFLGSLVLATTFVGVGFLWLRQRHAK